MEQNKMNILYQITEIKRFIKNITINEKLRKVIQDYNFIYLNEINQDEQDRTIQQNIRESKVIIINHYQSKASNELHFIISFRRTIIILKQELFIPYYKKLISYNPDIQIIFLKNTEKFFRNTNIFFKSEYLITIEIDAITKLDESIKIQIHNQPNLCQAIKTCISSYLIKESYLKLTNDRITDYFTENKPVKKLKLSENDYIVLIELLGSGSSFKVELVYAIEEESLFAIKKPNSVYKIKKLKERELENYSEINHVFLPKFYGTTNDEYIIIEYINGINLEKIDINCLSYIDILTIIFQLILTINYLHENDFIYRDLKPNNIIIDERKTLVLVDFDRMIKSSDININENNQISTQSLSFGSNFVAPEIANSNDPKNITKKCDIYSFGCILSFLLSDKTKSKDLSININQKIYDFINIIKDECLNIDFENRPDSIEIINMIIEFLIDNNIVLKNIDPQTMYKIAKECEYNKLKHDYFLNASKLNYLEATYELGLIYMKGKIVEKDMKKAIEYFEKAANGNNKNAKFQLGLMHYSGREYISKDIEKALNYFLEASEEPKSVTESFYYLGLIYEEKNDFINAKDCYIIASEHNNKNAQFNLALIYEDKLNDIKNAIKYYKMAANNQHSKARYNLGLIYEHGLNVEKNLNAAVNYYNGASDLNNSEAQFKLGIYHEKYENDIETAVKFYKKASDQDHIKASYNLGLIYEKKGKIDEAMNLIKFAANQNLAAALFWLGVFYYEGKYVKKNIYKSISYFIKAAEQNYTDAQINLGCTFTENEKIPIDVSQVYKNLLTAANKNNSNAQFYLGYMYYEGIYVKQDIKTGIYYYQLSANQNNSHSQCNLGIYYIKSKEISRAIDLFIRSANQNNTYAHYNLGLIFLKSKYKIGSILNLGVFWLMKAEKENFVVNFQRAFLHHEGIVFKQNILKSLDLYKIASLQNYRFAHNNIGVIFKNGHGNQIRKDLYCAQAFFEKGIELNDHLSMYNLSHLLIYEIPNEININRSIQLLIKSADLGFNPSIQLLSLLLIKKHGIDDQKIKSELENYMKNPNDMINRLFSFIRFQKFDQIIDHFENSFRNYGKIDFLYDGSLKEIMTSTINIREIRENRLKFSSEFLLKT